MSDKPKKGIAAIKKASQKPTAVTPQKIISPPFYKAYNFQLYMLWIAMTCLLTFFIIPSSRFKILLLKPGDISSKDIKSPWDFTIEDHETTIGRQKDAESSVLPVYDYNTQLRSEVIEKVTALFENMRAFYNEKNEFIYANDPNINPTDPNEMLESFQAEKQQNQPEKDWRQEWSRYAQEKGIDIDYAVYLIFEERNFDDRIENEMVQTLSEIMKKGVLPGYSFSFNEQEHGLIKRNLVNQTEDKVQDISQILDIEGAKKYISSRVLAFSPDDEILTMAIIPIMRGLVSPNITFNLSETRSRIDTARESVTPAFFHVKKGEMIIREGEKASTDQVQKLIALNKMKRKERVLQSILGLALIIGLMLMIIFILLKRFRPKYIQKFSNLLLIAFSILITTGLFRIGVFIAQSLPSTIPMIFPETYFFAFPFAAAGLIIAILLDVEIAIMVSAIVAILAGLLLNRDLNLFIFAFFGSLGGIYFLSFRKNRASIARSGLIVSLVNLGIIIPIDLLKGTLFTTSGIFDLFFGFIGGIIVIAFVLALLPLLEAFFQVSTDVKLLELLNLNQPLLRRLAIQAPGTYHHCIVVANLAEAACEAINANSLLARVASYYHDIGKIKMPRYYIENQMDHKNEHENLSPSMSSLILTSHVKDGMELGKKYKLYMPIIDIIQQHHGTNLIKYFYNKAKEMQVKGGQEVKEEDYRYPGPKPQTKEAGIVMLADAVEATSRTLADPRPARIQGMIQNIINNIFRDGQLDECELTLKDLHQIAGIFNLILNGIFHPRIAYPSEGSSEEDKKEKIGDLNSKPSKEAKTGHRADEEGRGEDIRRLGISNPGSEHNIRK